MLIEAIVSRVVEGIFFINVIFDGEDVTEQVGTLSSHLLSEEEAAVVGVVGGGRLCGSVAVALIEEAGSGIGLAATVWVK